MVTEQQFRETLRRWVELLNAKDWDAFDRLVDEVVTGDYVGHLPGAQGPVRGPEGLKQYFHAFNFHSTIEDVLAAGDKAAVRFTARRTDPVTGKAQRATVVMISHLKGGKFAEDWEMAGPWEDEA